ncbi:MAG: alpha/beta hydrolase [Alphaproteobacteria bacterium]|nr:alpha/beta hydrolase [Alphaproteobacteria bacterium]
MQFSDGFFTTADDLRLHYRDYPAQGGETGLPVVCLHGLTRNVKDFEELAPQIAALGRRVLVVSQRGRGQSDYDPQAERYQPATYAADMIGFLEGLSLEKAVFVGTSMGGIITMVVNALRPDLVASAVINDIGAEINEAGLDRIRQNVSSRDPVKSWDEAAERAKASNLEAFPLREGDAEFWDNFGRKVFVARDDGLLHLDYDGAITSKIDSTDAPKLWDFWMPAFEGKPVLLIRGGITDLLTPETVAEMKARKPDMDFAEVPNVGHAPFMTEPEAWTAIKAFMERVG